MSIPVIIEFLKALDSNNNRDWFATNKAWYHEVKTEFEIFSDCLIAEISKFDDDIKHIQSKDCIFRIYRDTRFAKDKTPYKSHFGVFIAAAGGRKSKRAGYYIHIDPAGSFIASGVWCPDPFLLKALRESVVDNVDELDELIEDSEFKSTFPVFFDEDKLKTLPKGFPKDFKHGELLKLKHYLVKHELSNEIISKSDIVMKIASICKIAYPFNTFFNYTVDNVPSIDLKKSRMK